MIYYLCIINIRRDVMDSEKIITFVNTSISVNDIEKAEGVLIDNGIPEDEASTVLQAIGYTLIDSELYPDKN